MTRVLIREGTDARTLVQIYLEVVQPVMIYRSETWVMTPCIGGVWGKFHHRVVCRLTGRQPQREWDVVWAYPPPVGRNRRCSIAGGGDLLLPYPEHSCTVYHDQDHYEPVSRVDSRLETRVAKRWWEQDGMDLEGMHTAAREAERT